MSNKSLATMVQDNRAWLEHPERQKELAKVLPKGMTPAGFIRVVTTAYIQNPELVRCSLESMWLTVMQAAALGVPLNGIFAAAVPFKGKATLVMMAQGYTELMMRHPRVLSVEPRIIYARDRFEYEEGLDPRLVHHRVAPCADDAAGDRDVIAAYARGRIHGGGKPFVFLWREEIEKDHRAYSKQKDNPRGPWVCHYPAMCEKTAVLMLAKIMPKSPQFLMARALDVEREQDEGGVSVPVPNGTSVETIMDAIAGDAVEPKAETVDA